MLVINILRYFSEKIINSAKENERKMQEIITEAEKDLAAGLPGTALSKAHLLTVMGFYVEIQVWVGTRLAKINTWLHRIFVL